MEDLSQKPKVEFFEEKINRSYNPVDVKSSKIILFVIKISGGHIKSEDQAQKVLIGFSFLLIAVSIFIFLGIGSNSNIAELPPGTIVVSESGEPPYLAFPIK